MYFEILDHPADIGFRAYGERLEGLFANSAHALLSIIIETENILSRERVAIFAEGDGYETLLVNWLNEVLYYVDGKRIALGDFDVVRLSATGIECVAAGEPRDRNKHPPRLVVKAVTYHQLSVRSAENGWMAEVYLDV